jgi:hypothetical protein
VFKSLGLYLIDHRLVAACLTLLLASAPLVGLPFMFSCAAIVMALVTLRDGPKQGALLLFCTAVPSLVWYMQQGSILYLMNHVLLGSSLVWVLASVLCVTCSWRLMLLWGSLFLVSMLLLMQWQWFTLMAELFVPAIKATLQAMIARTALNPSAGQLDGWVHAMVLRMPGVWVMLSAVSACLLLVIARAWQSSLYNPGGLRRELLGIRVGRAGLWVFLLVVGVALSGAVLAQNIAIVLILPFAINGLSITHVLLGRFGSKADFILIGLYVMMALFLHIVLFYLLVIGLLDSALDFRNRQRPSRA